MATLNEINYGCFRFYRCLSCTNFIARTKKDIYLELQLQKIFYQENIICFYKINIVAMDNRNVIDNELRKYFKYLLRVALA